MFSIPVKDTNLIESLFVGSSSSEHDDLIRGSTVGDGTIGTMSGSCSGCVDFGPSLIDGMVGP